MKSLWILALFLAFSTISLANGPVSSYQPKEVISQQGYCSWHEGVCGCSFGRVTCCDGASSPSCSCDRDHPVDLISFDTELCSGELKMAQGYHYVQPYYRNDGTMVQGHYQTNPNSTTLDNWSTKGNVNPFTGQTGTRSPYYNSTYDTNTNTKSNSIYDYGHSNDD